MKTKKIALVGNSALTMLNFRLGVMTELSKTYDVTMITPKDCDTAILAKRGIHFIPIDVDCKGLNPFRDLNLVHVLNRIYRQEHFDFVFHYTIKPIIYGSFVAGRAGIPFISIVTGLGYSFIRRNWLFHLSRLMHKWALKKADSVWFLNQDDCDSFVNWHIVDRDHTHVIHGEGVNTDLFTAKPKMDNVFRFLFCGRMLRSKGVELYVEAARRLKHEYPEVEFQLLGPLDSPNPDAITPEEIETWIKEGYVSYLGVTKDVRPYLEKCSCMVLPSYYMEGVPRSLMEAASMERPIITTDSVGCKEVVEDGVNGFLCVKRNVESLYQAMHKMLSLSEEELKAMGSNGRKLMVAKFDEKIILQEYVQYLNRSI